MENEDALSLDLSLNGAEKAHNEAGASVSNRQHHRRAKSEESTENLHPWRMVNNEVENNNTEGYKGDVEQDKEEAFGADWTSTLEETAAFKQNDERNGTRRKQNMAKASDTNENARQVLSAECPLASGEHEEEVCKILKKEGVSPNLYKAEQKFSKCEQNELSASAKFNNYKENQDMDIFKRGKRKTFKPVVKKRQPEVKREIVVSCYRYYKKLKCVFDLTHVVEIYEHDITKLTGVSAIVCREAADGRGKGEIAKLLLQNGGEPYEKAKTNKFSSVHTDGEVVITKAGKNPFSWVMHAIVPRKVTHGLSFVYKNIFEAAKQRKMVSLALPMFREAVDGGMVEELFYELVEFYRFNKRSCLTVHLVLKDKKMDQTVRTVFKRCIEDMERSRTGRARIDWIKDNMLTVPTDKLGSQEDCVICMDKMVEAVKLSCGHEFCKGCIDEYFQVKKVCPTCGHVYGILTGNQPDGTMEIWKRRIHLSGYEKHKTIAVRYHFSAGRQLSDHPCPGASYRGITRTAYLPDSTEGREVCAMLKVAFERRLVFTIGSSRTSGREGVITWNDIHHKTDCRPNKQFGFPDPTYLQRVRDELAAKGVAEHDIQISLIEKLGKETYREIFYAI